MKRRKIFDKLNFCVPKEVQRSVRIALNMYAVVYGDLQTGNEPASRNVYRMVYELRAQTTTIITCMTFVWLRNRHPTIKLRSYGTLETTHGACSPDQRKIIIERIFFFNKNGFSVWHSVQKLNLKVGNLHLLKQKCTTTLLCWVVRSHLAFLVIVLDSICKSAIHRQSYRLLDSTTSLSLSL